MNFSFSSMDPTALAKPRETSLESGTLEVAQSILTELEADPAALSRYAQSLDGLAPGDPLVYTRKDLERDFQSFDPSGQRLLRRVCERIEFFARAQRESLRDLEVEIQGGVAGHRFVPHRVAGCYAPGGRFPLPSSVLMTVVPAKVAGVQKTWVASPRPALIVRAAAYVAGADALLAAGGAQAIGALAMGVGSVPRCDVIVGPGNRYVTAAKHLVRDRIAIDMLAGPSELVILADQSADPDLVACDLLAQAEHDPDAWPVLITTCTMLVDRVKQRLDARLREMPCPDTAIQALAKGGFVVAESEEELVRYSESAAAEHLQLMTCAPEQLAAKLSRYGALFIGSASGEVMGDYGAGPNHVLPTGGTARSRGGLSVLDFLSLKTWMRLDRSDPGYGAVVQDAVSLAREEGLAAHALSAERRLASK